MNPTDCNHDDRRLKGTDTENEPSTVYVEYYCNDCGATISDVYEPNGERLVMPESGGYFETTV